MIPGHIYLSQVIPPDEKIALAVLLIASAVFLSYLMVRGIIQYAEWRNSRRMGEVVT